MAANLPPVAVPRRRATYDDVLAAPEHLVAEILDGELVLSPHPAHRHARASSILGADSIRAFDREGNDPSRPESPGGWFFLDEPELHLDDDVVVPDIAAWRRERRPRDAEAKWFESPPDWLCETLSPSTERVDRGRKLRIYARAGVSHVWLLDPRARTLEVLCRGGEGLYVVVAVHAGDERPAAEPFAEAELELARLWLD